MKKLALLGAALTFGLLAITPTAVAFHGAPYHAHGVATLGNRAFLADVDWNGWAWQPTYYFVVTIKDPLTGAPVVDRDAFLGCETLFGGYPVPSRWEFFLYGGMNAVAPGGSCTGASGEGSFFKVTGVQNILLLPQLQQMLYEGTYRDYQLVLVVDGPN